MFLKVLLVSVTSMIGLLLLEQYILLTREPERVVCDGGDETIPLDASPLLEEYPLPKCFEDWWQDKAKGK